MVGLPQANNDRDYPAAGILVEVCNGAPLAATRHSGR